MKQQALTALILLQSKTIQLMLAKLLHEYQIDSKFVTSATEMAASLTESEPDLIFVSKESAVQCGFEPLDYFERLRALFSGPIILVSADRDIENIEAYVSAGVTDVFSVAEFEQIENFVNNFISYRDTLRDIKKSTILLVEDSKAIMSMVTETFAQQDIEVLSVPTGREALTVLHFEQIDLVITDFMLEGDMTGLALIRNIRRTTQWYSLPVLAITGYPDVERDKELLRNGVSDVLHKPFDLEVFLIKCQNLILNKRTFQSLIEKQEELRELSNSDPMTGLPNRFFITRETERLLQQTPSSNESLYMLHLDCDNFKQVNHIVGHEGGDQVLCQIGQYLKSMVAAGYMVGRLDGDEFILILPKVGFDTALQIADLVREGIAQMIFDGFTVTVSVGVSGQADEQVSFTELYKDSNKAVFQAKTSGKNKVCVGELIFQNLAD